MVEEGQLVLREGVGDVAQLVRIDAHVVVGDEAGDELTVERVVRRVQRPDAPVRVVVGVHADAEGTCIHPIHPIHPGLIWRTKE